MKENFVNALRNLAEIAQKAVENAEIADEKLVVSELSKCLEMFNYGEAVEPATEEEIKQVVDLLK